ncbi:MAG: hypothetical protein ABGY11_00025 [Candidatus Thioglobus sp.]
MSMSDWIDCIMVFLVFAGTMALFSLITWALLSFVGWLIDNWID